MYKISTHLAIMKGAAESRENVVIDHQFVGNTDIGFFNVSFVNITTLTMRCPVINLTESHITVKSSNLNGYPGINEILSFIKISRGSQALLDNCTFKENCLVENLFSDGIVVSNSIFQLYRHQDLSIIIAAYSSVVILTGNVNFTDSSTVGIHSSFRGVFGTAVLLQTILLP